MNKREAEIDAVDSRKVAPAVEIHEELKRVDDGVLAASPGIVENADIVQPNIAGDANKVGAFGIFARRLSG